MKQINSILRTLCLTALLCMASVSASAYKVYDQSCDLSSIAEFTDTDKILVLKDPVTTNEFIVPEEYAVIIERGLYVNTRFENRGYKIVGMKMLQPTMEMAKKHYAEHVGKPFYERFFCSTWIYFICILKRKKLNNKRINLS